MKREDIITKNIDIAEKAILALTKAGDLKKLPEQIASNIASFYEIRSLHRLSTAKHIYNASKNPRQYLLPDNYHDYGESVAAAYYAMYYIVHAYLAAVYKTKLREDLRGVHIITHHLVLYYLVKTKRLAKHLYEAYVKTLETTSTLQHITIDSFQDKAYTFAELYNKNKEARETFTYKTTPTIEAYHAERALKYAEEFIQIIRELLLKH